MLFNFDSENYIILLFAAACLLCGIREFVYYKKGYGISVKLLGENHGWVKPNGTRLEKVNLLIESMVFLILGVGLIVLIISN